MMIRVNRREIPGKKNDTVQIYVIKTDKSIQNHGAASHKETTLHSNTEKDIQYHEAQEK